MANTTVPIRSWGESESPYREATAKPSPARICGLSRLVLFVAVGSVAALSAIAIALGVTLTRSPSSASAPGPQSTAPLNFIGFGDFGRRGSTRQIATASAMARCEQSR